MYQEYRDWERAFQKKTANEKAPVNTERLWTHLRPHIPVTQKKNRWLPFFMVLGAVALALPLWLWKQNNQLHSTNAELRSQLSASNHLLSLCQNKIVLPPLKDKIETAQQARSIHPGSMIGKKRTALMHSYANEKPTFTSPSTTPEDKEISEVHVSALTSREEVNGESIPVLLPRLFNKKTVNAPSINRTLPTNNLPVSSYNLHLALLGGNSALQGRLTSDKEAVENEMDYNFALQLQLGKYINKNWLIGAEMQYVLARNTTSYTHTSEQRTETHGTTQIIIDGSGNTTPSNGITGATTYHQLKARLYNWQQQYLIGPVLGYVFYQGKKPIVSLSASVLWMVNSTHSGRTPLGNATLAGYESAQWIYQQRAPNLGLGVSWHQQLGHKLSLSLGMQASHKADQFTGPWGVMQRSGWVWNSSIGLKKYF